jgi:hypothetical protein
MTLRQVVGARGCCPEFQLFWPRSRNGNSYPTTCDPLFSFFTYGWLWYCCAPAGASAMLKPESTRAPHELHRENGSAAARVDNIESAIRDNPGLSAKQIEQLLFGDIGQGERVHGICRILWQLGRAERRGTGRAHDPFKYYSTQTK